MSDAKSIKSSHILKMFRFPSLSNAPQITWVYSVPVCKKIEKLDGQLPEILGTLLQELSKISVKANHTPEDRLTVVASQAFAASSIFSNLHDLKSAWQQLDFYHRSANIEFNDFLQIGLEVLSEPYKQEHPLHLFHGFDLQQCSNWNLSNSEFHLSRHPLQVYLKKKFMVLLVDRIRKCDGASDYKRSNNGLVKRTSRRKMCEALSQRGNSETSMLILHKILAKAKDFNTQNPQRSDYQKLNAAYQKALAVENLPACSLQEAQDRLAELGSSIRSYGKSNMRSLNEAGEYGSELIDRFSQHNYSTPLENCLKLERQAQAENLKRQVHQQLNELSPIDLEAFWLKASGYNDSTIAQAQSIGAGSTVKRRRDRTISKLMKVPINKNFSTIADSYMEVAKDYFEFNTR